jgi:uncharacterized protein (DUF2062 family)
VKPSFLHRRLVQPLAALLTQGITSEKVALSLAFGIVLGVFPLLGSTTLLCAAAAVVLRLNLPAIQLVNYFVYPVQLALIVPFMRAGEILYRAQPARLSLAQILAMARADLPHAISTLWVAALHAVSVWLLLAPLVIFVLYFSLLYPVRRLSALAHLNQRAVGGA